MLSQAQRSAILELHAKGVSKHEIARVLNISRLTIRKVLRSNSSQVPPLLRPEKAEPYRQQILELLTNCKGNLVRVQEELAAQGATFSYQALTAFCRRHGIGQPPTVAAGHYHFTPGEELQHDTSPHLTGQSAALNRPIRLITRQTILREAKHYYFPVGIFFRRRWALLPAQVLAGLCPSRAPFNYDYICPTFRPSVQDRNRLGRRVRRDYLCGDALIAATIRSSVTDAVASRRTMNITTGLRSGAVFATVAGRHLRSCRCFLSLTRITACWLVVRHCGGAWWRVAAGKRQHLRSRIRIVCPIHPRSAAGPMDWTDCNRQPPFCAKRLPGSFPG